MPKRINPSSKLGQTQIQQAQRQRQRPSAQPAAASSSSLQHRSTTSRTEEGRQVGQGLQLTESEMKTIYEEQNTVVYAHQAMRKHLLGFTGVTLEPELDPNTGLVLSLDLNIISKLIKEVTENVAKLHRVTFPEKEAMMDIFDATPGRLTSAGKRVKEWARDNRPDLYREYIETAFVDFTRICTETGTGKARQKEDTRGGMIRAMDNMRLDYNKNIHLPLRQ